MRRTLRRIYKAANAQRAHSPSQAPPVVVSISPSIGSPNVDTAVTITGTGFTGATAVDIGSFGSTPAAGNLFSGLTVVDDTSITGTVAHTGATAGDSYSVKVTGPGGNNTLADSFTIPLAGIDSITPNSGTHTGNTNITCAGWGFVNQNTTEITLGGGSISPDTVGATDTSITGRTAAHAAGAVTATVTCDAGLLTTAGNVFTFT